MEHKDIKKAFEGRWRIKNPYQLYGEEVKALCLDFFEAGVLIGQGSVSGNTISNKKQTTPFDRLISFNRSVFTTGNEQKYGQQMLQDFFDYWSEPNPSGTKMRFELQKTWDINRRLARWARNNFNQYGTDNKPTIEQQRMSKLADILAG